MTLILRIICLLSIIYCTDCISLHTLTSEDYKSIETGARSLVLLRVECFTDGQPCKPFTCTGMARLPLMTFGIGTFETVGEPRFVVNRFLSDESCENGWTFFLLSPGLYYLSVYGPSSAVPGGGDYLGKAPRWQVDIPENSRFVYTGCPIRPPRTPNPVLSERLLSNPLPAASTL